MVKQKISNLFIILGIFIVGIPILGLDFQKTEADLPLKGLAYVFEEEGLVLLEENTLLATSNPANPEPKVVQKLKVVVTAYSSTPWQTDDSPYLTAAGTWVKEGIIANNLLPFGTKVKMPELYGDKVFVVEDRMHWKKGYYHIDIWFPSYWEAKNFGVERTYIEVLES